MEFLFVIIIVIAFVVKQARKSSSSSGSGQSAAGTQNTQYRYTPSSAQTRSAAQTRTSTPNRYSTSSNTGSFNRRVNTTATQRDGRVYASIDFDNTHYHAEGFDFDCCISFKGLPPGTDELAVLIASNNRHERELAKLMKERQA